VLPAVVGTTLVVLGGQTALGGFLMAIINGNEAKFLSQVKTPVSSTAAERETYGRRAAG